MPIEIFDQDGIRFKRFKSDYDSYETAPRMISENRRCLNVSDHPRATIKYYEVAESNAIVCPYCSYRHEIGDMSDSEIYDADGETFECYSCEKDFQVTADFGYGFISKPIECRHHEYVFLSQYYFSDRTWRIFGCLHCGIQNCFVCPDKKYDYEKQEWYYADGPARTLLPWLKEYDNPDYFDPAGILKPTTYVDLGVPAATPILDFLNKVDYWTKQPYWQNMRQQIGQELDKYAPKANNE